MRRSCGHTQAHCLHGVGCYFGESGLQKAPGQHKGSTRKPGKYQQRSSVEWPSPSPLYACWWCRGWTRDPAPRGPHQVTFWNTAWELWPGDVSQGSRTMRLLLESETKSAWCLLGTHTAMSPAHPSCTQEAGGICNETSESRTGDRH